MPIFNANLEIKIPSSEYKLFDLLGKTFDLRPKELIKENLSFILDNEDDLIIEIKKRRSRDSTIVLELSKPEFDPIKEMAKKLDTKPERLIASAVPLLILHNEDRILEKAGSNREAVSKEINKLKK